MRVARGYATTDQVAIGPAFLAVRATAGDRCPVMTPDPECELGRLAETVARSRAQLDHILLDVAGHARQEQLQILKTHCLLLADRRWEERPHALILDKGYSAEMAVRQTTLELIAHLQASDDPYLKERSVDIEQVAERILRNLGGDHGLDLAQVPNGAILVAHDLAPSEIIRMQPGKVAGIITDLGGPTSHMAIMARSLDIPALVGTENATQTLQSGELVVLDGRRGNAIATPDPSTLRYFHREQQREHAEERALGSLRDLPATTPDGVEIRLLANLELTREVRRMAHYGVQAVGLYRTEYLFTDATPPSEEEHYRAYRQLLHGCAPHPVTIRTVDLGTDKAAPILDVETEKNPALGFRGVRCCIAHRELFVPQLRALLRASAFGHLRILLPMVSTAAEVVAVRELLHVVAVELSEAHIPHAEQVELGAMIEVPSAALTCDHIARVADFLSIGTNDLVQYLMAADRTNEHVAYLTDPLHPAILRVIREVVRRADRQGVEVEVCGEMGGNPLVVPLLMGLGVKALSMSLAKVPHVKRIIRAVPYADAHRLAVAVLRMDETAPIRDRLERFYQDHLPEAAAASALKITLHAQ